MRKIFYGLLYVLFLAWITVVPAVSHAAENNQTPAAEVKNTDIIEISDKDKKIEDMVISSDYSSFVKLIDEGAIAPDTVVVGRPIAVVTISNNLLRKFSKLIDTGADINSRDLRGRTLLTLAARKIRPDFVEVILSKKGVDTYAKDADNKTALDYVKNFSEKQARELIDIDKRPESINQLTAQAKKIESLIVEYRRNSVLAVDSNYLFVYLPAGWVKVLQYEVLEIPVWRFVLAVLIMLLTYILNKTFWVYFDRLAEKYKVKSEKDKRSFIYYFVVAVQSSMRFLIRWFGLYFVIAMIAPAILNSAAWAFDVIITITFAIFFYNLSAIMETLLFIWLDKSAINLSEALSSLIRKSVRVVIVVWAALHIYSLITGNSVTTLIAGLGIGGMAVALAATDTIKNLLGFITIITDRPFALGDRVEIKGCDGIVEHIGMRTTRIRRLDGHQVSIPNASTVSDAVRNIERRPYLKKEISITITYDTPIAKIEKAVQIVKDILRDHEGMSEDRPPRVYFTNMNADNLEIIATYWYFPADWYAFCEFNEKFNFELMRRYEDEGIEFAFPTQTLYLADDPNRRIVVQNMEYKKK